MAGAFGWKFILFSAVFYMFLGMILGLGGDKYLTASINSPTNYTSSDIATTNITTSNYVSYLWQNPFSAMGWLSWLTLAFLITDIYIIVMSLIP